MNKHDSVFLKKFSLVIGFLLLVTLGLILFARHLNHLLPPEVTAEARAQEEARIAPVGAVYAGQEGVALQLAATEAAKSAALKHAGFVAGQEFLRGRVGQALPGFGGFAL